MYKHILVSLISLFPILRITKGLRDLTSHAVRKGKAGRSFAHALALAVLCTCLSTTAWATVRLNPAEGHVNFYKHTGPPDDVYTNSPTPAVIEFMNTYWPRLLTFTGYWDQNMKLSWYPDAWAYFDAYAIYSDPIDTFWAQLIQQHPDWILRDAKGQPLYINWACGGGACPQYAANIADPYGYRAFWISQAHLYLNRTLPYRGLFIDDVNFDLSRVSDGYGNPVAPVDPNTGRPMTNEAWRSYFADYMAQVRAALPTSELVHNSLWFLDWTDLNIQREIQAADWINLERGVNDPGLTGGTGYWSLNRLFAFIDNVHSNGKGVILDGEAWVGSDSDTAREYSLACYFLISTGSDMVGDTSQTPSRWWNGFTTDLGKAQGGRYSWQNLWRRDFAGGIALVNPPGSSPMVVTLPAPFIRLDGSVVNSLTLNPATGTVLLAPARLSSLQCIPSSLSSGMASNCTVTLQAPAPVGGATINVSKTSSLLSTPISITVATGSTSAVFVVTAGNTLYTQTASITATLNGGSVTTSLGLIGPAGVAPPPSCQVSSTTGKPKETSFTIQDRNVGLASIVTTTSTNAEVRIPSFAPGITSPIIVTATQVNPGITSRADFQASNMTGGITTCGSSVAARQWTRLAENASGAIVLAATTDGRLHGFFRGTDSALWTVVQASPGGPWSLEQSLGGVIKGDPAVGMNASGRLEVFAVGGDNSLWHIWQMSSGGTWSAWSGLGGTLISNPALPATKMAGSKFSPSELTALCGTCGKLPPREIGLAGIL